MTKLSKNDDLPYWVGFSLISNLGPKNWQRIIRYFPDLKTAWQAEVKEIIKAGLNEKLANEIHSKRLEIEPDLEWQKLIDQKIKVTTCLDEQYPKLLKEIYDPPPLLYYRGNFNLNQDFCLAVVGSRRIGNYGKQVTEELVGQLSQRGLTIVSGLALGVDACAHQAAINNHGKTVAVLGSGLQRIYPASNTKLAEQIINRNGAIISEFPLGTLPLKYNFPRRNRIISGLSLGVLITQAKEKSGALITADYALEHNREVFAVPGNIFQEGSFGPHRLIKAGAKLVETAQDILEVLNLESIKELKIANQVLPTNSTEEKIIEILKTEQMHIDKIARYARLDISIINATLSVMEMKGLIKHLGGSNYAKTR
ncbi:MAG: DNA-processing protein DprA [Patescibacteria group bacterium]|jgi:DNA processing protein|nr:DNA-processing protein DprA [Patescibacteria group bacterium]